MLKNSEDQWVEDREEVKQMAFNFYKQLFSSNSKIDEEFIRGCFPNLDEEQRGCLEKEVTISETRKALFDMGS